MAEYALDVQDFGSLAPLELPSSAIADEIWTLDQGGAQFLQSVFQSSEATSKHEYPTQRHTFRDLKMERPLLETDAQLDMQKLFWNSRRRVPLKDAHLDAFPSTEDNTAQPILEWPLYERNLLQTKDRQSLSEALQTSLEEMIYLRNIVNPTRDEAQAEAVINADLVRQRVSSSTISLLRRTRVDSVAACNQTLDTSSLAAFASVVPWLHGCRSIPDGSNFKPDRSHSGEFTRL